MSLTIAVTGEPRSGTSLMMRVLKELDLDILGSKFPIKNHKNVDKKRIERVKYLNPEGFWEVGGVVARGTKKESIKNLKGNTIKLICRAMLRTPREVIDEIDKVIFCARNPREVMQSQTKLVSQTMIASEEDWKFSPEVSKIDYTRYKISVGRYILAAQKAGVWERTLVIDYNDMLFDTKNQIKKICNFLNIPYEIEYTYYKDGEVNEGFIDNINASRLIRSDLYRSKEVKEYDKLAMDLYKGIKNKNFNRLEKPIKQFIEKSKIKNTRWLDDTEYKTWVVAGWDLYKSLKINNKGVRTKLRSTARINSLPIRDCIYYDPIGKKYTIRRVRQLPDLTRTMIKCEECIYFRDPEFPTEDFLKRPKGEVTREFCYNCWQQKMIKKSNIEAK